ncbi:hypothetical protein [Gimesia panareensis]|uniref:Uncharacterized protein n=1 Tax=Gimesia panareensis TaxID=2527978 RepID=A0A517Q5S7_9PLAN|nr:hypothetical protein [Gimesia panareensis]QDT26972.1 hypothetical protein Enr10x_22850 [Gimesia panareensis]QDU50177.1 hypothetical protein Pan110_25200 [Gimesia panareensis]
MNYLFSRGSFASVCCVGCLFVLQTLASASQQPKDPGHEKIGTVMGQAVYRDQLRTGKNISLREELFRLFAHPVKEHYIKEHRKAIVPTEREISFAASWFCKDQQILRLDQKEKNMIRQQILTIEKRLKTDQLTKAEQKELKDQQTELQACLDMPCRTFAHFMLDRWKFQRHLYLTYGRGRILWQQAGIEAFDAMYRWLQDREKQGEFSIDDPRLHSEFYAYWTSQKHGAFLTGDQKRIRDFLKPKWVPDTIKTENHFKKPGAKQNQK